MVMAGSETELENQYDKAKKALDTVFESQKSEHQDQIYRVLEKSKEFENYVLTPSFKSVAEIEDRAEFYKAYGMLDTAIKDIDCTPTLNLKEAAIEDFKNKMQGAKKARGAKSIAKEALELAENPISSINIKKLTVVLQTTTALFLTLSGNTSMLNKNLLAHQIATQQLSSERKYAAIRYAAAGFLLIVGFAAGFFTAGTSTVAGIYLAGIILGTIATTTAVTHQSRQIKQYTDLRSKAESFSNQLGELPGVSLSKPGFFDGLKAIFTPQKCSAETPAPQI